MNRDEVKSLKIGSVFYRVVCDNNVARRKKICRVIDGVEWFRYDLVLKTYRVEEFVVLGILTKTLEGLWPESEDYELVTQYFVESIGRELSHKFTTDDTWLTGEGIFLDYENANAYRDDMQRTIEEMDRI